MSKSKFVDNTGDFNQSLAKAITESLEAVLLTYEATIISSFYDFPKPPIDTGALIGTITSFTTSPTTGIVSAGGDLQKEYATYVEFGTVKMSPRPFFRNGISKLDGTELFYKELKKRV